MARKGRAKAQSVSDAPIRTFTHAAVGRRSSTVSIGSSTEAKRSDTVGPQHSRSGSPRKRKENCVGVVTAGVLVRRLIGGESSHTFCVEDEGLGLRFGALRWELFTIPEETYACGIANANHEFP